jgi:hydroxyacylglutathione hydrolase
MPIFRETGRVAEGVYLMDVGIWGIAKQMALYVIKSADKVVLIDTGTKKEVETVIIELDKLEVPSVDYILVTHSHMDHCGGLIDLAVKFPRAEIGIPYAAQDLRKEWNKKVEKLGLSNPMQLLKEGTLIKLDASYRLEVLETPGHIDDHISFLLRPQRILFVGDACGAHHLGQNFSRPSAYAPYFHHEKYINSLLRFQKINPHGLGIASYGFASDSHALDCIKTAIIDYQNWMHVVIKSVKENFDEDYVSGELLKKFGRSPGEILENRTDQWVKTILRGIARGFINSLGLMKK